MPETLDITLDDGTGQAYDEALRETTLPEGADLRIITKDRATQGGRPAVMVTFTVHLPDGSRRRVQAVTTARLFLMAAAAVRGRYPEE